MLPFNTFSIHDLLGLMGTAPLAVIFYLIYAGPGGRKVELLFANLIACSAGLCLVMFLEDNVVAAGVPATAVPNAAQRTLLFMRISNAIGLLCAVFLLHFAVEYAEREGFLRRHIYWAYLLCGAAIPLIWTPWLWRVRTAPLAQTSSWVCALPWMPVAGPLVHAYLLVWAAVGVYVLWILWHHHRRVRARGRASTQSGLIFLAVSIPLAGGLVDMVVGATALHAGLAVFPVTSLGMAALMAAALVKERLDAERRRQRIHQEMGIAAQIQQNLLPDEPPRIEGFELAGWSRSASPTGGDNFDFMVLPDGQVMIMLGDAAGHGMGPALMIAQTRAVVRAVALGRQDPSHILRDAAELLVRDFPEDRFVTCFLGVLDPASSTLNYASAGQGPILYYCRSKDRIERRNATGPPISTALSTSAMAMLEQLPMEPGDFVIVSTDGFSEARNRHHELIGIERVTEALYAARDRAAEGLIAAARQAVEQFVEEAEQEDDMTIVVVRRTPSD